MTHAMADQVLQMGSPSFTREAAAVQHSPKQQRQSQERLPPLSHAVSAPSLPTRALGASPTDAIGGARRNLVSSSSSSSQILQSPMASRWAAACAACVLSPSHRRSIDSVASGYMGSPKKSSKWQHNAARSNHEQPLSTGDGKRPDRERIFAEAQARLAKVPSIESLEQDAEARDAKLDECRTQLAACQETLRQAGYRLEQRGIQLAECLDANAETAKKASFVDALAAKSSMRAFIMQHKNSAPYQQSNSSMEGTFLENHRAHQQQSWSPELCLKRRLRLQCSAAGHWGDSRSPAAARLNRVAGCKDNIDRKSVV